MSDVITPVQVSQQNSRGYENHMARIANADDLWRRALIDTPESQWVGNKLIKGKITNNVGTLRHEDHQRIMEQLISIRRRSLVGISDLMAAGLSSVEDIGTQLVGRESINEFQDAKISMNPTALQSNDTNFSLEYTPLPIVHQSWRIPFRQLGFSYKRSAGLSESVRKVSEKLEDMLFNGETSIVVTVNAVNTVIQGYTTFTNRMTGSITDWSDLASNRTTIVPEVIALLDTMFDSGAVSANNSIVMYVPNNFWNYLQDDYSLTHGGGKSILQRLLELSQIRDIKPAEKLAAGEVVMVEMEDRTVELAVASDIVTVPHERASQLDDQVFTTYAAMVPIFKSDRNNESGVMHAT